ncbi:MAG TPA: RNA polymerase sigma factor [Puia sp.]|nr:RNA polymerase sigma factor [Puia sp.]
MQNDRRSQEELYKRFFPAVMALCLRYVRDRNDAVEVLNDSFLKVFRQLGRYDAAKGALYTWMRTIVIHTALDSLRRQRAIRDREMLPDADEEPGVDNEALAKMSGDELLNLILRLPITTRLVFNLYTIDGYTHREVAVLLGMSEGTSRWHLNDARRQLKIIINLMNSQV